MNRNTIMSSEKDQSYLLLSSSTSLSSTRSHQGTQTRIDDRLMGTSDMVNNDPVSYDVTYSGSVSNQSRSTQTDSNMLPSGGDNNPN